MVCGLFGWQLSLYAVATALPLCFFHTRSTRTVSALPCSFAVRQLAECSLHLCACCCVREMLFPLLTLCPSSFSFAPHCHPPLDFAALPPLSPEKKGCFYVLVLCHQLVLFSHQNTVKVGPPFTFSFSISLLSFGASRTLHSVCHTCCSCFLFSCLFICVFVCFRLTTTCFFFLSPLLAFKSASR